MGKHNNTQCVHDVTESCERVKGNTADVISDLDLRPKEGGKLEGDFEIELTFYIWTDKPFYEERTLRTKERKLKYT